MPVDDLWYLSRRDPETRERLKAKRHGRGKRYRVRWVDENGKPKAELFERKTDAERHDANVRADLSRGVYIDPKGGRTTVADYAAEWQKQQLHRDSTAERVERAFRLHVNPILGELKLSQVRTSHLRGWVKDRSGVMEASTLRVIFSGILAPMFNAAVADRVLGLSPCVGIRLPEVADAQYTIATADQVHGLYEQLPDRYRAVVYVAAGCGLRAGEVFGLEDTHVDFLRREIAVAQQLKAVSGRKPFIGPTKTRTSRRTVELAEVTGTALARHLEKHPAKEVSVDDLIDDRHPTRRAARLLFTNAAGEPVHRASWSHVWSAAVRTVGLPRGYGLRDLRHYFATVLIYGGANVKTVQLAMGHTTPTVTLNVYTGYWPDSLDRTRALVDAALGKPGSAQVVPAMYPGGTG